MHSPAADLRYCGAPHLSKETEAVSPSLCALLFNFFLDRKCPARGANVSVTRRWWVPFPPGIKLAWLWQLHPHSTTIVSAQATSHPTIFLPTLFSSWIEREKTWFPCPRMPPETISNLWRCRQKIHRRRNKPLSCRWRSMRFNARAERASDQWTWMSS